MAGELPAGNVQGFAWWCEEFALIRGDGERPPVPIGERHRDLDELRPPVPVTQSLGVLDCEVELAELEVLPFACPALNRCLGIGAGDIVGAGPGRGALAHGEEDDHGEADHEDGDRESRDFLPAHLSILAL